MRLRISWILCGAALVVSGSMGMAACGSGSAGPDGGTGGSAGSGGTKGSGSGGSTGSGSGGTTGSGTGGTAGTGTGGTAGTGGDAGCGKAGKVFAETPDSGMYCPFSGDGGKGTTQYCKAPSQACCVAKYDPDAGASVPSVCVDSTTILADGGGCTTGPGSILFECEGPLDCTGSAAGGVCCGSGTVEANTGCSVDAGFGYVSGAAGKGTSCAASCGAGQTVICSVQTDCTGGTICTPADLHGNHIGYCL
jgi:hypothetical protein